MLQTCFKTLFGHFWNFPKKTKPFGFRRRTPTSAYRRPPVAVARRQGHMQRRPPMPRFKIFRAESREGNVQNCAGFPSRAPAAGGFDKIFQNATTETTRKNTHSRLAPAARRRTLPWRVVQKASNGAQTTEKTRFKIEIWLRMS